MGLIEFLILIVVVCIIAAVGVWLVGQVGAPAIVPKIIWIVAVCIILYALLAATGILGHDIRIPHV